MSPINARLFPESQVTTIDFDREIIFVGSDLVSMSAKKKKKKPSQ